MRRPPTGCSTWPRDLRQVAEDTVENEIRRSESGALCSPGGNTLRSCFLDQPILVDNQRIVDVADLARWVEHNPRT